MRAKARADPRGVQARYSGRERSLSRFDIVERRQRALEHLLLAAELEREQVEVCDHASSLPQIGVAP